MISNNTQEKAYLCIRNHLERKCGKRLNINHFNLVSTDYIVSKSRDRILCQFCFETCTATDVETVSETESV